MPSAARPIRRVPLSFRHHDELLAEEPVRGDLSATAAVGRTLFVANDELVGVERLISQDGGHSYGQHQPFHLYPMFALPEAEEGDEGPAAGEMDIEGLEIADGYPWIVGSHSATRKRPKLASKGPEKALKRLKKLRHHPNRHFLGRVPLREGSERGVYVLEGEVSNDDGTRRHFASLKMTKKGSKLDKLLRDDELLAPFLGLPAKENGFDIEGIAARGSRVFLGLRGPVLRGIAVVVELDLEETETETERLEPAKLGPDGARYRLHFLDLGGLGIRDLRFDGETMLVLAGPTMDLSGPVHVVRWQTPLAHRGGGFVLPDQLQLVLDLPHGQGEDHAEGICRLPDPASGEATDQLLVIYDSPAPARLRGHGTAIDADVFSLPLP